MHPPRFTVGRHLLIVAACGVGLASMQGNHLWFMGLSMMTVIGLLGAAIGAGPEAARPGPSPPLL
jgi:hypothetical protein